MKRRLGLAGPALMLGVCLVLGYIVLDELGRGPDPAPGSVAATPETVAAPPERAAPRAKPLGSFSETLARPLFDASRRPRPKPSASAPEVAAAEIPVVKLVGVVIGPDGRSALIRIPSSAELVEVSVGERIDGWRLEAIETDRIVFKSGTASAVYRIDAELR